MTSPYVACCPAVLRGSWWEAAVFRGRTRPTLPIGSCRSQWRPVKPPECVRRLQFAPANPRVRYPRQMSRPSLFAKAPIWGRCDEGMSPRAIRFFVQQLDGEWAGFCVVGKRRTILTSRRKGDDTKDSVLEPAGWQVAVSDLREEADPSGKQSWNLN